MRRDPRYRYLINNHPDRLEVHDLDDERRGCQIDEIVNFEYLIGTGEGNLQAFLRQNPTYDGCKWCLEEYHRK